MTEDVFEEPLQAHHLIQRRLPCIWLPQFVGLREVGLNWPMRIVLVNPGSAASAIAGVDTYDLTKKLLKVSAKPLRRLNNSVLLP